MDSILATNRNFLVSDWFQSALHYEENDSAVYSIALGACKQITIWGPKGENNNYAMKQWAGLMKGYVHKRWDLFLSALIKSMEDGTTFNDAEVKKHIFESLERTFCDKAYPFNDYLYIYTGGRLLCR